MAVTVDTAVGGNRERDLHTGFAFNEIKLSSIFSFASHPMGIKLFNKTKMELSNLKDHISEGTTVMTTIGDYFTKMLDNSMNWKMLKTLIKMSQFCNQKGYVQLETLRKSCRC